MRKTTKRTDRDHYIMTRDINRLRRIVENEDICLDENDAVSIKVWATQLQQDSAKVILKDKIDPPPPESRLSQDTFVLCIQTGFQKDLLMQTTDSV